MLLGILAMFQPWFGALFENLQMDDLFEDVIAPTVFRYGFYATFYGTVAFIVLSHHTPESLQDEFDAKGKPLTFLLAAMPVITGFAVLGGLVRGHDLAALVGVAGFITGIAIWNWRRWGLVGFGLTTIVWLVMAFSGTASIGWGVTLLVSAILIGVLVWPKREQFT